MHTWKADPVTVLVVGSGAAGMMAAYGAARAGARVRIITKGSFPAGITSMVRGGFSAAVASVDPQDTPGRHAEDVLRVGCGINNRSLVKVVTQDIVEVVHLLVEMGMPFDRDSEGRLHQAPSVGDSSPRLLHVADQTGPPLMRTLASWIRSHPGIEVAEYSMLIDVYVHPTDGVGGAWVFDCRRGAVVYHPCCAVVLCTGGAGQLWKRTDNPPYTTGDGQAVALRAGAECVDMEMQDFQLCLCHPKRLDGYTPYPTAFLSRGARLINGVGDRFMKRWDPGLMERAPRFLTARAVALEIQEGRAGPYGGVFLDASDVWEDVSVVAPSVANRLRKAGIDPGWQALHMSVGAHTMLGGIRVGTEGQTCIPGLLAAGEAAGGVHGAGRLGGMALAAALVLGLRAGRAAALRSAGVCEEPIGVTPLVQRIVAPNASPGRSSVRHLRTELRALMQSACGAVRHGEELTKALSEVRDLRAIAGRQGVGSNPKEITEWLELQNLLLCAEAVVASAISRTESRGSHYRRDFPKLGGEEWEINICAALKDDAVCTYLCRNSAEV